MRRSLPWILLPLVLSISACDWLTGPPTPPVDQNGDQSSSEQHVTPNVTYQGMLEEAGISIYMQGSHRLSLDNGGFLLLDDSDVDLDAHVGERVEVFGDVRPTVEAGGLIMRVERISSLKASSEAASSEEARSEAVASEAASSADAQQSSPRPASSRAAASSVLPASAASQGPTTGISAHAEAMARMNLAPEQWTQKYCSAHIGFCVPVHRNWWYKSYGTTTTSLWHVEMSSQEILNLGEGPLAVKLVSGSIAAVNASDGLVRAQGDLVIGYRSWNDNRHFEITAPQNLESAVRHILGNIEAFAGE